MTNTEKFISLIKENPDIPVIPFINYEAIGDNEGLRYIGSFGNVRIGELAVYAVYDGSNKCFDDREYFIEYYYEYNEEYLCEKFNYKPEINEHSVKNGKYTQEQLEENNKNEKLMDEYLEKVADKYFKKVIFVDINPY